MGEILKKICVIGSINIDYSFDVTNFPKPGETILARSFKKSFGGKGANQAIAAARLGGNVTLCGVVGGDADGKAYIDHLRSMGVGTGAIVVYERVATGIAIVNVDQHCENTIIVYPGANGGLGTTRVAEMARYSDAEIFMLQLEVPLESVYHALGILHDAGKTVILDPAPATCLPSDIYSWIDFLTPNVSETEKLSGVEIRCEEDIRKAGEVLLAMGVRSVIVKAGAVGAYLVSSGRFEHFPSFHVESVDTTGAGDSFNGAFAVALSEGRSIEDCMRYANAAGALSTRSMGAQESMPTDAEACALVEGS